MIKHTEGPWCLGKEKDGATSIDSQGWDSLALVYTMVDCVVDQEGVGNAVLIANAPEMYAFIWRCAEGHIAPDDVVRLANDLLARIEVDAP